MGEPPVDTEYIHTMYVLLVDTLDLPNTRFTWDQRDTELIVMTDKKFNEVGIILQFRRGSLCLHSSSEVFENVSPSSQSHQGS